MGMDGCYDYPIIYDTLLTATVFHELQGLGQRHQTPLPRRQR